MPNYKILLFCLSIVISLICLILELSITDSLQDNSADYIYSLQRHANASSEEFFKLVADAAEYLAMGIGLFLYVLLYNQAARVCIILTFFITWLGDVLKMLIAHPRPFWYDSRIKAMQCARDFGSPSGHAIVVGAIIIYFYFLLFKKYKILSKIIAAALLALVAVDRNYLGVHFYFQVVLGYSLAFLAVCILNLTQAVEFFEQITANMKKTAIVETGAFICLLTGILVFNLRNPYLGNEWKNNYANRCSGNINATDAMFVSFLESSAIMIPAGFVLGAYLDSYQHFRTWKYMVAGCVLLVVAGIVEQILEQLAKSLEHSAAITIFCVLRFAIGFYVAFVVPFILSRFFKRDNLEVELSEGIPS
jgi:membrane-associated phospholipid phosphatase